MINNQYINKWMAAVPQPDTIAKKIRSTLRYLYLSLASKNMNKNNSSDFLRCIYCHYVFDDQIEKFEKIRDQIRWWGPSTVMQIENEDLRKKAIAYVRDIEEFCGNLIEQMAKNIEDG